MIETLADGLALTLREIPPEHDPRLVDGVGTRRKRLAELSPVQRAALVLERYPELRALPNCDWERLSRQASFTILFGEAARHNARLQLAALAGVLASAGTSDAYAKELEDAVRRVLDLLQQRFDITTPRAMYRGVLFGTAIVTLMLTADARIHEILQISADHFVTPVRVYVVKNPDGTPKVDPIANKIVTDVIVEQRLLPKGRKRDDLRLHYDVSAGRVHLQEMTRLLKAAHGGQIPIVPYDPLHPKAEQLGAERYLFQWNGRHLSRGAINGLIRLVLHGVVLVDRSGERISVTSHLLRHAAATVQRQQYGVPLEMLAEAMGHTLGANGQAPEATRYYSQMTDKQKHEIRHETIMAMMDDARTAMRVIEPNEEAQRIQRLMAEADEHTRDVLERYGGMHPVTFGHCGYPGLCVRGTARAFCIGCPFLVRRPEYVDRVDFFLDGYVKAADAHERMGDLAGARERNRLIAQLKQLRSEMLLLAEAERQGHWTPSWQQVPSLPAAVA